MQISNKHYRIVYDPELADNDVTIPFEISDEIEELHEKCRKGKHSVKPRLLKLIQRYPKLPFLRNYLITWHIVNGNNSEAARLNDELIAQFPDYIFAKSFKIQEMIKEGKIAEAQDLLGNRFNIEELYPERNAYHLSEFRAFSIAAVYCLAASYRFDEAESQIELLREVEIDDDAVSHLDIIIMKYKLERGRRKMHENEKLKITAVQRTECTLPARDVEMKPQNIRFKYLYGNQWQFDESLLKEHIINDKEQLILEFQHILRTAIEGYTFISESGEWNAAVLHAFLIFPYLDDEAAFASILEFYRQPYEYADYWLMDWDTELMTVFFRRCSESRLQQIFSFLAESPGVSYHKITLLSLLPVFVLQSPDVRDTLVTFVQSVLEYYIANRNDENLFDSDVIAYAVGAASDLKATGLLDIIRELFDKGWVSLMVGGDFEEVSNRMYRIDGILKTSFYDDVFAHIHHLHSEEKENEERRQAQFEEMFRRDIAEIANDRNPDNNRGGRINVSRNSPCPCGSSKKYKRCHGK